MNFKRVKGDAGERYTQNYLSKNRFKIIAANYSCRMGEIDVIAARGELLCFVEVKTRSCLSVDRPSAAVDYGKQARIIKTAQHFLMNSPEYLAFQPRFDVAEVIMDGGKITEFNYIENAFGEG